MKIEVLLILAILFISFTSATEVEFSCPNEVRIEEEFFCELEIVEGNGLYDVKIEIKEGSETIVKVLNEEKWKSGYYYLQEFINFGDKKEVHMKIFREGEFEGILKLRQGSTIETFNFEISINNGVKEENFEETLEDIRPPKKIQIVEKQGVIDEEVIKTEVLTLNAVPVVEEEGFFYKKSDYIWKGIFLVIILLLIRLIWEKL